MLAMAKKHKYKRLPVQKEERVPATPETATKLRPYHISSLAQEYQEAAGVIEIAWRLLTGPLCSKAAQPERMGNVRRFEYTRAQLLLINRYKQWANELPRRRLDLDLVISLIVDGMEPREWDWRTHHEGGWAAERLIESLALYNRMAQNISLDSIPEDD